MVESEMSKENIEESRNDNLWSKDSAPRGCHRDPSFSGWFDENGNLHSAQLVNNRHNNNHGAEDFDFELPKGTEKNVVASIGTETNQFSRCSSSNSSSNFKHRISRGGDFVIGSGEDRYVSFDIETGSPSDREYVDDDDDDDGDHHSALSDYNDISPKNVISEIDVLKTLFFILVWYSVSLFLTLYNKTLLGDDLGKFPAPLLMNTVHFAMQAVLSKVITGFWSQRFQPTVMMSWKDYSLRVVPTALTTAMDVNLSNASLVFISVTFATMCKSASPIFLLFFAFAFRLESPSLKLLGIILIISAGILLTVAKETEFQFWGFVFVMLAAVMSGFRWTMTQILLQKEAYGLKNPLTLMSYVTPVMALSTAFLSLIFDPWNEFGSTNYFDNSWHIARSCLLMLFGGTLAFFMVLTEYILVSITSAVTVTIAGVVKEAVTILVAVFYFHDEFTWTKGLGLTIIMFGVSLFNWYKYDKLQKGSTSEDELTGLPFGNAAAKYVILEELEAQDHVP